MAYYPNANPYPYSYQRQYQQPYHGTFFVKGRQSVDQYYLPPSSDAIFFDTDQPIMYSKVTDDAGYATIEEYEYHKIEKPAQVAPVPVQDQGYVTREEYEQLMAQIKEMRSTYEQPDVQQDVPATTAKQSGRQNKPSA